MTTTTDGRAGLERVGAFCATLACVVPLALVFLGFVLIVGGFLVWAAIEAGGPWKLVFIVGLLGGGAFAVVCGRSLFIHCRRERCGKRAKAA